MQIVIPMSGYGERFRREGYKVPKPLIKINNRYMIEYVVKMFDKKSQIIFICNNNHLNNKNLNMRKILKEIAPKSKVIGISPHKLGPVYAVLKAQNFININLPTIVNYSDFTCYWDFKKFKDIITKKESNIDGAIPCYKNFHPHTIWSNYYAYVKLNNLNEVIDIREKKPFTKFPVNEYASSGTYFFKDGYTMLKYFKKTVSLKLKVKNEYYASMSYKPMIKDKKKIIVHHLKHFMQWGTPTDLKDYLYWSKCFDLLQKDRNILKLPGYTILPMAGKGSRFVKVGYKTPKPLILVSGKKMIEQALNDLPITDYNRIIIRETNSKKNHNTNSLLSSIRKKTQLIKLKRITNGQASTCLSGVKGIDKNTCVTFGACDNGMIYNNKKFLNLFNDNDVDIIVWAIRGYPSAFRQPNMYGWIKTYKDSDKINYVSVKQPIHDPNIDPIIIGTFTFKKLNYFLKSFLELKKNKGKINNEYYLDSCINEAINLKYNCYIFEVDSFLCWGTPNELNTFEYWQSCFDKWKLHKYKIDKDQRVNLKNFSNKFYE